MNGVSFVVSFFLGGRKEGGKYVLGGSLRVLPVNFQGVRK